MPFSLQEIGMQNHKVKRAWSAVAHGVAKSWTL